MPKTATGATTLAEFATSPELLARFQAAGRPVRVAVDGGSVVVLTEEAYRKMWAEGEKAAVLEGLLDVDAGRVMDAKEFFAQLRRDTA